MAQGSIYATMAMPERSETPLRDSMSVDSTITPRPCQGLGQWDSSPEEYTGSETRRVPALAAISDGECAVSDTVYEIEPSRGSPTRQLIDYTDTHNSTGQFDHMHSRPGGRTSTEGATTAARQAAATVCNCSSCGIALVEGNTFSGGRKAGSCAVIALAV